MRNVLWVTPLAAACLLMKVRYDLPDFRRRMLAAERFIVSLIEINLR